MSYQLDEAKRKLDQAIAAFEAESKKLVRPDGTPKYSAAEQKERMALLLAPVEKAAQAAQAAAQAAREQASQAATLADFDPLLSLASKQSDLVMVKQAIIAPSVDSMPLPDLARRILATAAHGDEVDKRLYALHTQKRLDGLRRAAQSTGQGTPDGFAEAAQALYQLQAGLVDKEATQRLQAAQQQRQGADELTRYASQRMAEITGAQKQAQEDFKQLQHSWV